VVARNQMYGRLASPTATSHLDTMLWAAAKAYRFLSSLHGLPLKKGAFGSVTDASSVSSSTTMSFGKPSEGFRTFFHMTSHSQSPTSFLKKFATGYWTAAETAYDPCQPGSLANIGWLKSTHTMRPLLRAQVSKPAGSGKVVVSKRKNRVAPGSAASTQTLSTRMGVDGKARRPKRCHVGLPPGIAPCERFGFAVLVRELQAECALAGHPRPPGGEACTDR